MTMLASTLEILEAADFSPKQARALARAIDGEIKGVDYLTAPVFETKLNAAFDAKLDATLNARNFVTMPVFEMGLAELKLELARLENRVCNKMVGLGMTGIGLTLTGVYFLVLKLKR
jgi:hypothetical protein